MGEVIGGGFAEFHGMKILIIVTDFKLPKP